jgi:hypothetical protein
MVGRSAALLCIALGGCAAAPADGVRSALAPGPVIRGARLEATGPYTLLLNPLAVAGSGAEVYVADAGLALLLRVDPYAGVMTPVLRRAFAPGTRIAADADGTLYVLDAVERRVRRYARNGRLLVDYAVDATVGSVTDMVLDSARGRLLVADSLHRQLVVFHPLGRAFEVLPLRASDRDAVLALGALAAGPAALHVADPRCACIARIDRDGRVSGTYGHGELRQPGRLVVDRFDRTIVADAGSLKVLQAGRVTEEIAFARFGISSVTDLALAEDWLYLADAQRREVRMLRVLAP